MMNTLIIGIDVSQNQIDVAYWNGSKPQFIGGFENHTDGFEQLTSVVSTLQRQLGAEETVAVMEPTGGYQQLLARFAIGESWQVAAERYKPSDGLNHSAPNPKQLRDWAKGMGYRAKTDFQDAKMLAHYGASVQPPAFPPPATSVEVLADLLNRRSDLDPMRQMEQNRLHASAHRQGVRFSPIWNV